MESFHKCNAIVVMSPNHCNIVNETIFNVFFGDTETLDFLTQLQYCKVKFNGPIVLPSHVVQDTSRAIFSTFEGIVAETVIDQN